jgi:hypothetical protein
MSGAGILVIFSMIICGNPLVFGVQMLNISPTCGPVGYNVVIDANGFAPNTNVAWKLVNSKDPSKVPTYAYFMTNATGGLTEVTVFDDVPAGSYKLILFNDMNNDGKPDPGATISYANVTMPCP